MRAALTLLPLQGPARLLVIRSGETLVVGRDPACDLVLEDPRVSKRHAELRWTGAGWGLHDLASKNGTIVNNAPARGAELAHGDEISFGGLPGRFELLPAAPVGATEPSARLQPARGNTAPADLLLCFLEAAMQLTRTERGFVVVVTPKGKLRVEVAAGLSPEAVQDERFMGSVGAVRQALGSRMSVVLSDVRADPRLGKRPSVVSGGIASLACVPIRHDHSVLGVIYVDSRKLGPALSELELETLENMAEHVGTILAAAQAAGEAEPPSSAPRGDVVAQLQARIEELLPAL